MNDISPQRWLALGLLGLVILCVIFIIIVPLVSMGLENNQQKQELIFRLKKAKQVVARKDSVLVNIEQIKKKYLAQNYFSTRDTEALASADLQKLIKSAITEAGGQLTSTQVLPGLATENGFNRIVVKVRMSGDMEALRSVLHEIESSSQIMVIDQIDIRPVRGRRNRRTRKIEPSSKLNINFQVAGFMRKSNE
ncbi:MAG: type II secretion system protein GspM [Methylococcales bacterium]